MSANPTQFKQTVPGTNSPPTGDDKPMGQASVDGSINAGHIPDREQRKEYFPGLDEKPEEKAPPAKNQSKKMGQSMADTMEQRMK